MNQYTINFSNRVTHETVTISYKIILADPEEHKSITQVGSVSYQRFASQHIFFQSGQPALNLIRDIDDAMDADKYRLATINFASSEDEHVLKVPSKEAIVQVVAEHQGDSPQIKVAHQLLLG
ncbi:hypothetical protein AYR62_04850 [Secundilactobacillus paracollinoides]|uniref:Uncharacterized protein n=1 Tax=Secundilactobacillus paracollinoides TaxID=240427 RepID=A0A1B2J0D3_9LACO|nr:hypothetical protein [Secundilactobacillus paracollinoides]ANZ61843.1 hypothetical protein AYR61_11125 [Secundilactobacillus paracollinoides]ANZ63480.1 hypothetical protein AYR62_04850 [Secundilactobacillus paracollinoides]ANZ67762.1 hypothetical protein AYR63_11880 [Secundilactobacillus paracollinoides]